MHLYFLVCFMKVNSDVHGGWVVDWLAFAVGFQGHLFDNVAKDRVATLFNRRLDQLAELNFRPGGSKETVS